MHEPTHRNKPLHRIQRLLPHLLWVALIAVVIGTQWRLFTGFASEATEDAHEAIAWRTDWSAALAESAETGRPIVADFTADWCPPCQAMKRETWSDPRVQAALEADYIPLLLDVDKPGAAQVAQRYGVTAIPTITIYDADGGIARSVSGFMDAEAMLAFLAQRS